MVRLNSDVAINNRGNLLILVQQGGLRGRLLASPRSTDPPGVIDYHTDVGAPEVILQSTGDGRDVVVAATADLLRAPLIVSARSRLGGSD